MKLINNLLSKVMPEKEKQPILCDHIMAPDSYKIVNPFLSTEHICEWCDGHEHYCPFVDPNISASRVWLCANPLCLTYSKKKHLPATLTSLIHQRALPWPLFCEINGIGDTYHDVKFESINQSEGKLSYMLKFANTPKGIILMQGTPGTGKTYAALGICELYTRSDVSCIFTTQEQLTSKWLESVRESGHNHYLDKVINITLLVIDDFGTYEPPPGFLAFFMKLINSRLQWNSRGTVITTNLSDATFGKFCGEALSDRINTGQLFEFKGKTRRKQIIL